MAPRAGAVLMTIRIPFHLGCPACGYMGRFRLFKPLTDNPRTLRCPKCKHIGNAGDFPMYGPAKKPSGAA